MAELREAGAIGFSDDGLPIRSARMMRRALSYQRLCGGVIALHEEDPELSGDGVMHEGPVSATLGLSGIPSISESTMIARDVAIAAYEGARIHVQHLSARESVEAVRAAKAAGLAISCEATPHHLCLTDEAVRSLDASRHKMNPPLRAEGDRQSLLEGLRDGTIDCIATDHAPHLAEEKEVPFEAAAMGVTGLETAFAALHTNLVVPGALGLELLVEKLGCGGEPFGVPRASLSPGQRGQPRPLRPRRRVGGGGGGLREPLRQLLVRRGDPARPGADDDRRRAGRLPAAQLLPGGGLDAGPGSEVKLERQRAVLVVVDVQEAFRKAVPRFRRRSPLRQAPWCGGPRRWTCRSWSPSNTRRGSAAPSPRWRSICRTVTEPVEKVRFSAAEAEGFDLGGRDQALVCGIEAHVCVNQTTLDLLDRGIDVQVVTDAVASRDRGEPRGGAASSGAGRRRADQRRDRPVRAARRLRRAGVQAGPGARQVSAADAYVLLEDGARFDGIACGAEDRGARRSRLQHFDDRLPGGGDRPLLRRPDHHLHLSADRQLRGLGRGDGIGPGPRPGGDHAGSQRTARTWPAPKGAGSTG